MSSWIRVDPARTRGSRIENQITISPDLAQYFNGLRFYVDFDEEIDAGPGILNIPAVASLITTAWLTGSQLEVGKLDSTYFENIRKLRSIYEGFYPGLIRGPGLVAESTPTIETQGDGLALFFSGGLDSTYSLFQLLERRPRLITVGGFDAHLDRAGDAETWRSWKRQFSLFSDNEGLKINFIRTNSRAILDEIAVDHEYRDRLPFAFWDSLRHAPLLLGLVAPLSMGRFHELVISASRTPARPPGAKYPYSSTPITDKANAWAGLRVTHFGEIFRHEKVRALLEVLREGRIKFRSCWKPIPGNCSNCHKCLRLIAMLIAEGVDPNHVGFDVDDLTLGRIWQKSSTWDWPRRRHHWTAWLNDLPADVPDLYRIREFIKWMQEFRINSRW